MGWAVELRGVVAEPGKDCRMLEFGTFGWLLVIGCAVAIGFSKTSSVGVGLLFVPLLPLVMGARESVVFMIPMLCMADVLAVVYWRAHVSWPVLWRLLPWVLVGVLVGWQVLRVISDALLMPVIGGIILGLLVVAFWRRGGWGGEWSVGRRWWFAGAMGMLAGVTTMMANAAGPVMVIYLLAMGLEKREFVGMSAWFFWMVNLAKLGLAAPLGLMTVTSLATSVVLLPGIVAGGLLGIVLVHRIPQKRFNMAVSVVSGVAALYLLVKGIWQGCC